MVSAGRPVSLAPPCVVRPVTYTVAPARPSSTAMARPAPRVAPAISATFPASGFASPIAVLPPVILVVP